MAQISTPKRKRRTYSKELKAYLVEQALAGERSIASLAQGHSINPNLLQKWIKATRDQQIKTDLSKSSNCPPTHHLIGHEPSFLPVTLQSGIEDEQITPNIATIATLKGIQLQIPSHNSIPINLSIDQIDTHSLIELLRGLQ